MTSIYDIAIEKHPYLKSIIKDEDGGAVSVDGALLLIRPASRENCMNTSAIFHGPGKLEIPADKYTENQQIVAGIFTEIAVRALS